MSRDIIWRYDCSWSRQLPQFIGKMRMNVVVFPTQPPTILAISCFSYDPGDFLNMCLVDRKSDFSWWVISTLLIITTLFQEYFQVVYNDNNTRDDAVRLGSTCCQSHRFVCSGWTCYGSSILPSQQVREIILEIMYLSMIYLGKRTSSNNTWKYLKPGP